MEMTKTFETNGPYLHDRHKPSHDSRYRHSRSDTHARGIHALALSLHLSFSLSRTSLYHSERSATRSPGAATATAAAAPEGAPAPARRS
ncbi:unnamed protein product [Euphydryas editha]|uniref:Uncharacterized protein n=1 Tax=Euphydryas editha TaxID=104508 RepID=A0AAU9TRU0_EUPED|nr:unnamed protein product [Euphydryas editha]